MGNLGIDRTSMEPHFILALASLEQLSFDRPAPPEKWLPVDIESVTTVREQSGTRQYL